MRFRNHKKKIQKTLSLVELCPRACCTWQVLWSQCARAYRLTARYACKRCCRRGDIFCVEKRRLQRGDRGRFELAMRLLSHSHFEHLQLFIAKKDRLVPHSVWFPFDLVGRRSTTLSAAPFSRSIWNLRWHCVLLVLNLFHGSLETLELAERPSRDPVRST